MILNNLPQEHELRNLPLAGMYSRNTGNKLWVEITPAYGIAKATFNMLDLNAWCKTEFSNDGKD
jgi:hypothetical protein